MVDVRKEVVEVVVGILVVVDDPAPQTLQPVMVEP